MNEMIRAREIRVVDEEGGQVGIMTPEQALAIAQAQMEQVMNTDPDAIAASGPAADPTFPNYTVTVAVAGTNPKQVDVTVAWTPQGGQTSLTFTTLVADLD